MSPAKIVQCAIIVVSLALSPAAGAAPVKNADAIYAADYAAAKALKLALRKNDRRAVARLMAYPVGRNKPLPSIKTEQQFLESWDDYFGPASVQRLLNATPGEFGWRGVQLDNGSVWFSQGKVSRLNLETATYRKKLKAAISEESKMLTATARNYDALEFECQTAAHHVRVQQHGKDLRYFAWGRGEKLSGEPQLALRGGRLIPQGTGGNHDYDFKNGEYIYRVEVTHICGEDCNDYLTVEKNGQELSREVCAPL